MCFCCIFFLFILKYRIVNYKLEGTIMNLEISKKASEVSASPTLAIDSKFKQMKQQGVPVVGFGAGEPDFNTPDNIKQAAVKAIENNITKYTPASGTLELKQAVCDKIKRIQVLNILLQT